MKALGYYFRLQTVHKFSEMFRNEVKQCCGFIYTSFGSGFNGSRSATLVKRPKNGLLSRYLLYDTVPLCSFFCDFCDSELIFQRELL